jgi:hypothetical protein
VMCLGSLMTCSGIVNLMETSAELAGEVGR